VELPVSSSNQYLPVPWPHLVARVSTRYRPQPDSDPGVGRIPPATGGPPPRPPSITSTRSVPFSTSAVTRMLIEADTRREKRAKVVDKLAASYILQGFLDRLRT